MAKKKTKSQIYWQKRSEERLLDLLDNADSLAMKLDRYYSVAVKDIKKSIESLYARFEKDNKVDKNKALELIKGDEYKEWRFSMEEYLEKIKATNDEALLLELNTLAMRKRINRLEALEAEILAHSAILADVENENIGDFLEKGLEESYYKSIYDEYLQKDPKTLDLMANNHIKLSKDRVNKVLTLPWSGDNYSSNIWKNSYFIAKKTQSLVAKNIIAGKSIDSLTKEFTKVYGDSYRSNVRRLLRTETAYVKSQADVEMYKTLEVEEYEILATLDKRTSAICQEKDGLHYKVDEIAVGINYPPFHPNCRTTTIKYNPDTEGRTRLAKDKDGKNVKVPFDMKYEEWREWANGEDNEVFKEISEEFLRSKDRKNLKVEKLPKQKFNIMNFKDDFKLLYDYSDHEEHVAEWLSKNIGGKIYLCPKVLLPEKFKSPDYIWDNEKWDLKDVYKHSKNTITTAIGSTKNQSNNVILNLIDSTYSDVDLYREMKRVFFNKRYFYMDKIIILEDYKLRKIYGRK